MKISYNWLRQFLKIDWSAKKIGELLTDLGLEVEGISFFEPIKGGLKGVVVGHVLTCEKHRNADKLKVTFVDIGEEKPVQIICGAPNIACDQRVAVATIGTLLYNKEESFKIKKGKIRGEYSFGMICSEKELGIGTNSDDILVLNESISPGTNLSCVFDLHTDHVFEIGLTPNRTDAMSHYGVARDLRAGLLHRGIKSCLTTPSVADFRTSKESFKIDVEVVNNELTPRYTGVIISEIKIKKSPKWLQNRLKAIGLIPKNNVVDATNYVLHELGQPLHAFDAKKIQGDKIIVTTLEKGTEFVTLDGLQRSLSSDDIMICDSNLKPLCIAGVLGGLDSGVTEQTTQIFLESAYFNPVFIRKTAKRHGLNTDASFRFERGIDPNITKYALKRAALLIKELTSGKIASDIIDIYPNKIEDYKVTLNYNRINCLIGQEISKKTIKLILGYLEIKISSQTPDTLELIIPSYRVDVQREVDVIEEILRVYGYDNIETPNKLKISIAKENSKEHKILDLAINLLVNQGFFETITNSLSSSKYTKLSEKINDNNQIQIINPLSADLEVMRFSLLFSGLETLVHNVNRKNTNLKFFEFGKVYRKLERRYIEENHLSLFITGNRNNNTWTHDCEKYSFFYLKGVVDALLQRFGINKTKTVSLEDDLLSEGITLKVGELTIVSLGLVKKVVLELFAIKQKVLVADFHWDKINSIISQNHPIRVKDLPKFPYVKRDLSILIDKSVRFKELSESAFQAEPKLLKDVSLFDVYQGKNLPDDKKSYALSFLLQDDKKTLNDKQISNTMNKIQQIFEKKYNANLR